MSKWAILRKAILSSKNGDDSNESKDANAPSSSSQSIHRHDGYHVFTKSVGVRQSLP